MQLINALALSVNLILECADVVERDSRSTNRTVCFGCLLHGLTSLMASATSDSEVAIEVRAEVIPMWASVRDATVPPAASWLGMAPKGVMALAMARRAQQRSITS